MRSRRILLCLALLAPGSLSCAVPDGADLAGDTAYRAPAQPAARLGLMPAYRVFYDELSEDGDWVLIEPYGWVFRPRVTFDAWRPFQDGWWEPSDYYGWIWNSNEPFGWLTYHYGSWFYDSFQGWVWAPGPVWGPGWVAWAEVGDYIGWAPLPPHGYDEFSRVPGGAFTFVGARDLAAQTATSQALFVRSLPVKGAMLEPILNISQANGMTFNRGPDAARLARLGAALPGRADLPELRKVRLAAGAPAPISESELVARSRRMTNQAAHELALGRDSAASPPLVTPPPRIKTPPPPPPRDSTNTHPPVKPDTTRTAQHPRKAPLPERRPAAPDSTAN